MKVTSSAAPSARDNQNVHELVKDPPAKDDGKKLTTDASDEALVREHVGWMLAVAQRILNDHAHAEDAVQNAFTNVFRGLNDFEGRSALKTWIHRIVVNESLMILRKIKRKNESPIDPLLPQFDSGGCRVDQALTTVVTPETLLGSARLSAEVRQKISELPQNYRIVLTLRDIEELSTAEVSDALGVSEANVKVRLHRARAALKKRLESVYGSL